MRSAGIPVVTNSVQLKPCRANQMRGSRLHIPAARRWRTWTISSVTEGDTKCNAIHDRQHVVHVSRRNTEFCGAIESSFFASTRLGPYSPVRQVTVVQNHLILDPYISENDRLWRTLLMLRKFELGYRGRRWHGHLWFFGGQSLDRIAQNHQAEGKDEPHGKLLSWLTVPVLRRADVPLNQMIVVFRLRRIAL